MAKRRFTTALYILRADEVTYNSDTGEATADGHVVLDGGPNDEHLQASHGTYNVRAESGRFENVTGTIGVRMRGTRLMLTSSNPFSFTGKVVEKTGPDHYMVYDGTMTTCELPHPKWQFNAQQGCGQRRRQCQDLPQHVRHKGHPDSLFSLRHPARRSACRGNLDFSFPISGPLP